MQVLLGCVAPHPPLLIPEIGRANLSGVRSSQKALQKLGLRVATEAPESMVIISPHSPASRNVFGIKTSPILSGSFAQFGVSAVNFEIKNDLELVNEIILQAEDLNVKMAKLDSPWNEELDHGVLVPLYYLQEKQKCSIVSLSISEKTYQEHYLLGQAIQNAANSKGRKTVFVASGDMSHRLTRDGPYPYSPKGKEFDQKIKEILSNGSFGDLFKLDERLIDEAGECGLRSIFALAGVFDGYSVYPEVLSYEGPFGVGYLVASFQAKEKDEKRHFV